MNKLKVWPHLTIVAVICAAIGGIAAALWMRHEPKAEALSKPRAARVERVDGEVGLSRELAADTAEDRWIELTPNTPVTAGDRLYAREDSRASLAFTGRNFARLEPASSLDVLSLSDRHTRLALREGSAIFNIGELAPGEMFEVATPYGAFDLQQPGLYEVGYNDDGSAFVSVLSGLAQVVGLAGSGQISKGEMLTMLGQTAAQVALSRLSPEYAGGLLDDYYAYQYPDIYDGRYGNYDAYLNDPFYYDPYNRYESYRYVSGAVPGAYDLDNYGDWRNLDGYGYAWSPRVDAGWAPYRQGYWMMDDPYGLTWVSNEPWGYAPYHYGRWVNSDGRWYWVPDGADTRPAYAPALVAFLPLTGADQIGWVPLAPGDPYVPTYYDANWQPHYLGGSQALPERLVNLSVPEALTVVSSGDFNRVINPGALARFDPRSLDGVRPVLDPLSHAMLRQASLQTAVARRGFVLPPGLAKRLEGRQVYASSRPATPPFRDDPARSLRVEAVPEKQKREKLKFKDERQVAGPPVTDGGNGMGAGRREARELLRQERAQERDARSGESKQRQGPPSGAAGGGPPARAEQSARGERVGAARHAQGDVRQKHAEPARQNETRRQARQHAAQQRAQQHEQMRARKQQQVRSEQPKHQLRPAAKAHPVQAHRQQAPARQGQGRAAGPPSRPQNTGGQGKGGGKGKGRP